MTIAMLKRPIGSLLIAAAFGLFVAHATRADNVTDQNMTQNDYHDITNTYSSVEGEMPAELPSVVHDFSDANQKSVTDAGGKRLIKGKAWKKMSPSERDKALRNLDKNLDTSTYLMIEVPSGNVWAIPASAFNTLKNGKDIRLWTDEEFEKLPKSVRNDPAHPQEDRRSNAPTITLGANFKF